jgi:hypothetical protein
LPVVRTVFWGKSLGSGGLSIDPRDEKQGAAYCLACLAEGYHGYFHECGWLKKCPIHRTDLVKEVSYHQDGNPFDQSVCRLSALLDCHCPGWVLAEGNLLAKDAIRHHPALLKLLGWHRAVQFSVSRWAAACIGGVGFNKLVLLKGPYYRFWHYDLLLGRLGWITPIPKEITGLLVCGPFYRVPDVQFFSKKLADELCYLLTKYRLDDVLDFYKTANFVKGEFLPHQAIAQAAISALHVQHASKACPCQWRQRSVDGWERVEEGVPRSCCAYPCPYVVAQNELNHAWLDLWPKALFQRPCYWDYYRLRAEAAFKAGIVSVIGYAPVALGDGVLISRTPILKFDWSGQMTRLIEVILSKVVLGHIDELNYWLRAIALGGAPWCRDYFPPNLYLIRGEDSRLQVVSWLARERPTP